ncbi:MAG: histidine kinase, partial [Bacteroidales bacterium]|nr:histidine kinase [Bacteroidales bacterium]
LISSYENNYFIEVNNRGTISSYHKFFIRFMTSIFDYEGNLWVGTETGLYRLKSKAFINFTKESGINNYVWSIVEDKKGKIWFASFTNGMSVYDGKSISKYKRNFFPPEYRAFYRGAIRDQNMDLLFTNGKGVLKYNGESFLPLKDIPKAATLFLFDDTLNKKLLVSSSTHGLVIKENTGNTKIYNISPGPIKEYISTINMDKFGRYWLGGFYGMTILDGDSLIKLPTKEFPYSEGAISSYKDSLGNLWFGTTSGLYLYNYKTFQKIGTGKINSFVMSLAGMAGNKLFIGMVKGMGILDLKKFYANKEEDIMLFDHSNGFLGEECKQNGVLTDSKGYTWVTTSDRVIRIDPREIRKNTFKPRIYMKSVSVFSKRDGLNTKLAIDTSNVLPWFQNDIRFDYHAISPTTPEGVRYKYRLAGYDKGWSEPTKERYATYTNLKYGDYEFQVKACNCDQIWCKNPAVFSFSISPAFWQTKLFLFGSNAIILIFIITGMLYFIKRKRLIKEEKEKIDKQFTELQLKTIKNQMDPHFTFNAITSLGSLIYTEKKEAAYDFLVNFSRLIRATIESSDKISRTLQEELDFTKNYLDLQQFRFKNKLDYEVNVEDGVNMEIKVPRMLIHTHAENALKHGLMHLDKKGWLKINLKKEEDTLIIEISDNGIGRKRAKELNKDSTKKGLVITDQFYTLINKFNKEKIRQEIVDLCDGSGDSAGTKIIIYIPININYEF